MIELWIAGLPAPQGSKRHVGRGIMVESNEKTLRPWRSTIAFEAIRALEAFDPLGYPSRGPVRVTLGFSFPHPAGHFRTGKNAGLLKPSAPAVKATRPDIDKLVRAVLDALTGLAFADDGQVVELLAFKAFGHAGVAIAVDEVDPFVSPGIGFSGKFPFGVPSNGPVEALESPAP